MATNSSIEWTDATWNPTAGCSIVSPGCKNCYAMRMAARLEAMGQEKYAGTTKKVNRLAVWTGKITLDEDALAIPLGWKKPRRIFVNSMSDLFHKDVPFEFVHKVFAVMALCPQHTFQVLTKRTERMAEYFSGLTPGVIYEAARHCRGGIDGMIQLANRLYGRIPTWPLPNVWLGTSVEDQQRADERIPHLLRCPAAVRFLSCEPLLGPVDLCKLRFDREDRIVHKKAVEGTDCLGNISGGGIVGICCEPGIHWVIVGGESGPGSRPFNVEWAKSIIGQCKDGGVACFYKQGGSSNSCKHSGKGGCFECFPNDLKVREFPNV